MSLERLRRIKKSHLRLGVAFVFGILVGFVVFLPTGELVNEPVNEQTVAAEVATLPESKPVLLQIPEINLETTFEAPLGLNADNTAEVPDSYSQVGWYEYGPTPGELGPSVILGHVDSYLGPAVFFSLGQLEIADEILVTREDGSVATFAVTAMERPSQSAFPTAEVYGDIDHAGLRLITCSGTYQQGVQRYTHNLIVYAELVE